MVKSVRFFFLSVTIILAILIFGSHQDIFAQAGTSSADFIGTITDEQKNIISNAEVTIKDLKTNLSRVVATDEKGSYSIRQLTPGKYEIRIQADGFQSYVQEVLLQVGTIGVGNISLKVGQLEDVVEVSANAGVIESNKTESSSNVDAKAITSLPINKRNFLDLTLTAPRVRIDRTPPQGVATNSGFSVNGQSARSNNITIDGLDNNDLGSGIPRSAFSQDAIQEFQIVTDNYSAEFGRAVGGVVNIITKGGGNSFNGSSFFFFRDESIAARDSLAPFKTPFEQYQAGIILSGPIKRDKAFFFTSFERLSLKQGVVVTVSDQVINAFRRQGFQESNGSVPSGVGNTSFLGRIDYLLTPNNIFNVRYNYGGSFDGAFLPFFGARTQSAGGTQLLNDNSVAIRNTYINTKLNLVNESRFLYSRRDQDIFANGDFVGITLITPEGSIQAGSGTFLPNPRIENIYHFVNNVSLTKGRNQIKFGVDYIRITGEGRVPIAEKGAAQFEPIDFAALAGMPGLPFFTALEAFDPASRTPIQRSFLQFASAALPGMFPGFPSNLPLVDLPIPFGYTQGFNTQDLVPIEANLFSTFFQDDIKLKDNLLIKVGLRYDLNRVKLTPNNNGNISPRIAFSYNIKPNLNIHGSYGLFFTVPLIGPVASTQPLERKLLSLPFPFSIVPYSLPNNRFPITSTLPSGVNFQPQFGVETVFEKNLRNGYAQQANFGFDYFFDQNTVFSASYVMVRGIKVFGVRNINPVVRPVPNDPLQNVITGRVDPSRGEINQFESAFDSYYHSLTLTARKKLSNRIGFLAAYTFSKAIDNSVDLLPDLQEIQDPLNIGAERALSLQDARSRFVLSGVWQLSYSKNVLLRDFEASTILNLESGRPYNLRAGVDLNNNGDGGVADRPPGVPRNAGKAPGFANLDFRLTRNVKLKESINLQATVEIFNVFNRLNVRGQNRFFPPDSNGNFNLPAQKDGFFVLPPSRFFNTFAPRQFQLGLRIMF